MGLYPDELEWVSGKPSRWLDSNEHTIYVITPYEGDWTLDAARAAMSQITGAA